MPIEIGAAASADFTQPLQLLSDCHRRIERFLDVLLATVEKVEGGTLTADQRASMENALRYFEGAAPLHTADEEESLFPRMRASGNPSARDAMRILDSLERDHDMAGAAHAVVDRLAGRWLADGRLNPVETRELIMHLRDLRRLYEAHIEIEDDDVFPLAGSVLSPEEIAAVGREMMERRGIDPNRPTFIGRCAERRQARQAG